MILLLSLKKKTMNLILNIPRCFFYKLWLSSCFLKGNRRIFRQQLPSKLITVFPEARGFSGRKSCPNYGRQN